MPNDYVEFKGLHLPVSRSNQGLSDNETYLNDTIKQINTAFDCNLSDKCVLDFGCGQGRLLNGFQYTSQMPNEYVGIDVNPKSIAWCVQNLSYQANITFVWYNQLNDRYNTHGLRRKNLPLKNNYFDLIFANSVFTHLNLEDTIMYAKLLQKCAKNEARLYLTAFTEIDIGPVAINPDGYMGAFKDTSPLHRVRYNKYDFIAIFEKAGWTLEKYKQNSIGRTGQSELFFSA